MRIWHCETREQYDHLMKQLDTEGCEWGNLGTFNENLWESFKEHMCVREKGGKLFCCTRGFYEAEYPDVKIQPVVIPEPTSTDSIRELIRQDKEGKQLDEPQKVVIPKEIAEWIEEAKTNYLEWNDHSKGDFVIHCVYDLFQYGEGKPTYNFDIDDTISEWSKDNPYTFVRAIIDGYEVEKEKLYTVVLPNTNLETTNDYKWFLKRTDTGKVVLVQGVFNHDGDTKLTEEEIKSLDERYMAFAEEVTE